MNKKNDTQESNFLFFLRLVIENWKWLLGTYLIIGTLTIIILLVIPKWYKSEATIVVLDENKSSLSSLVSDFSALGFGLGGSGNVDTYREYLYTNKMYDRLIEEFNLEKIYEVEVKEDLYDNIFSNIGFSDNENQTFTISYSYKEDPEKAAQIVSFLYKQLDKIALEVDQAEASNFRKYIESYYQDVKEKLKTDEDSLTRFQQKTGFLDLSTQLSATISGLAELEKQRISLEIEKAYSTSMFQNPPQLSKIENQITAIKNKIDELKRTQSDIFLPLDRVPEQGANFLRLKRDIIVGEKVSEFLRLQYEQALLDEQKVNSNLYMVDPPVVPEKKFKPQRTKILFIVMFFTVVLSLIFIRVKEYILSNSYKFKQLFK